MYVTIHMYMYVSLSTVVLNSRDQGKLWLPHFYTFKNHLKTGFC